MSSRAACRLESMGFTDVYEYKAGKADWLAMGLPAEGTEAGIVRAGEEAESIPTCKIDEKLGAVIERVGSRELCAVTSAEDCVLGLVRLDGSEKKNALVEEVMQEGPSTWRPNVSAQELREYLRKKGKDEVLITNSEGQLVGLLSARDD
jgi:hypothetical protein